MQERSFLFILGRNPTLSNAELASVYSPGSPHTINGVSVLSIASSELQERRLFARLGGSTKLGVVVRELTPQALDETLADSIAAITQASSGKIAVGASVYGSPSLRSRVARVLLDAKRRARDDGRSLRIVTSREQTLSSVVVAKNHLLDRGREFLIVEEYGRLMLGHTLAVQDFEGQSQRDYGRPRRDPRRGMLPVQLARVMVNLALPTPGGVLFDAFCGSGTILQEALLLGHTVIGSDIDPHAVEDTRVNLAWLDKRIMNNELGIGERSVLLAADVRELSTKLRGKRVDAVVTEVSLGPPVRGQLDIRSVEAMRRVLLPLYRDAFAAFAGLLKPGGRVVAALPAWRVGSATHVVVDDLTTLMAPQFSIQHSVFSIPSRGTFLYGRSDQRVWREVIVAERVS